MRRLLVILMLPALMAVFTLPLSAEIKIGILAKRGPEVVKQRWGALEKYLSEQMGEPVTFVPLKFTEVMQWSLNNKDQFLFANSWFFVRAKAMRGAKALVSVQNKGTGAMFGGVIFAKKDSGIKRLEDLRGKVLMCPKFSSAGGWIFQKGVMVKAGIIPEKDCKMLLEGQTHDAVVFAVKTGKADVGTVRTNILERMGREGKININDYEIVHPIRYTDFPELCSTPLYPSWPIASLRDTPPTVAEKLQRSLLSLSPGASELEACRVDRFIKALDYGPLEELLKFLNLENLS
jgi:phosphate/phosphite/phosphonate ABC transporter binding protein